MGKAAILLVVAGLIGGTLLMYQATQATLDIDASEADRQEELLAREIARSGYNAMESKARRIIFDNPDIRPDDLVETAGTLEGDYEGGRYTAHLRHIGGSGYIVEATGSYGKASYTMNGQSVTRTLRADEDVVLQSSYYGSMAGYCSGLYVELWDPDHEDDPDYEPEHDMLFPPQNRHNHIPRVDGVAVRDYERVIPAGTQVNFVLAVDKSCDATGDFPGMYSDADIVVPFDYNRYNHYHWALEITAGEFEEMQEGMYAMVEESKSTPGVYRLTFEDLRKFSREQHEAIKEYGYTESGSSGKWNRGEGRYTDHKDWAFEPGTGFKVLEDFGDIPDMSDQTFTVEMIPHDEWLAAGGEEFEEADD